MHASASAIFLGKFSSRTTIIRLGGGIQAVPESVAINVDMVVLIRLDGATAIDHHLS